MGAGLWGGGGGGPGGAGPEEHGVCGGGRGGGNPAGAVPHGELAGGGAGADFKTTLLVTALAAGGLDQAVVGIQGGEDEVPHEVGGLDGVGVAAGGRGAAGSGECLEVDGRVRRHYLKTSSKLDL